MTPGELYELVVTPPAARALAERLSEPVAAAVIEFLTTTLINEPRRVGKQLHGQLAGVWSARRGTYRVLCRIADDPREVVVLRIEHRRDAYRPS
ncbi:MAG: type II toxin-antitoxin system RelE family toxin [Solirubrobacteraceae bacterium]